MTLPRVSQKCQDLKMTKCPKRNTKSFIVKQPQPQQKTQFGTAASKVMVVEEEVGEKPAEDDGREAEEEMKKLM